MARSATAWWNPRYGSHLQAASRRAAVCWPAQWRSGGGAGAQAVAGGTKPVRGVLRAGGVESERR